MDALRKDNFEAGIAARSREDAPGLLSVPCGDKPPHGRQTAPSRRKKARPILLGVMLIVFGAAGFYGWHWWSVGRFLETTDDAYLEADKVTVAPRIAGYVAEVFVGDNQPVKAGEVIARLDDREYQVALKQAQAEVEKDKADLQGVAAAINQQQAQIDQAAA